MCEKANETGKYFQKTTSYAKLYMESVYVHIMSMSSFASAACMYEWVNLCILFDHY